MAENSKSIPPLLSSQMPGADYGVFLLATPIIAILGLLTVALAAHSVVGMIWLLIFTALSTGLFAAGEIFQSPTAWRTGSPLKPMFSWLGLVAVLWPFGYPAYLRARQRFGLGNWFISGLVVEALFIAGAVAAGIITVTGYGKAPPPTTASVEQQFRILKTDPRWVPDTGDVNVVQSGHLNTCMDKTVKQLVDGYFASPKWEGGAAAGGIDFVNASGTVTYQGKSVTATFQFVMDKDKKGFSYQGFEIDGVPQTLFVAAFTLAQMCSS
ncbi:MAG TPA: hypothetical protein VFK12_09695 [Gammaproteobacteria bacterium]|nr:hypothetical protein [Gammaproteobacteria bacterium]